MENVLAIAPERQLYLQLGIDLNKGGGANMKLLKSIECTSCTSQLCTIREDVRAACLEFGYPEPNINEIVLAIDEACANVIRYGYQYCNNGSVGLDIYRTDQEAIFRIIDQCPEICDADLQAKPRNDEEPGGLGMHIIHQIMDSVALIEGNDRGNTLELRKQLPSKED